MTQIDKRLLLKDLCARLPYGVKCLVYFQKMNEVMTLKTGLPNSFGKWEFSNNHCSGCSDNFKPYLRPMSSMTEKERTKLEELDAFSAELGGHIPTLDSFDYLNSIHVDYRGLIYKGLALEAPEGMYNIR